MKTLSQIKALPIKLLALSFLLTFNFQTAKCQQLYSTSEGRIWIIAIVKDTAVNILSKHLFASINYNNAEISLTLDPRSLLSKNDSLNLLLALSGEPIILKGKLNIPFINTTKHAPQKLNFEGELFANRIRKKIPVTGTLVHIADASTVACELSLKLNILLSDFHITDNPLNISDSVSVEILQAILKRD